MLTEDFNDRGIFKMSISCFPKNVSLNPKAHHNLLSELNLTAAQSDLLRKKLYSRGFSMDVSSMDLL